MEQQVVKRRVKRDVQSMFNDPMWPRQWYLVSEQVSVALVEQLEN